MQSDCPAIDICNLRHLYVDRSGTHRFLLSVPRLRIPRRDWTSILGPSGCGKTTLQTICGLIRAPSCGAISAVDSFVINELLDGKADRVVRHDIAQLLREGKTGRRKIEELRRRLMGFYLQAGELLPTLTIQESVAMPLRLNGWSRSATTQRVNELLGYLLDISAHQIPRKLAAQLSGGQYQRVALARALAHRPQILFVDEPTSNLDPPNKRRALNLLSKLVEDEGTTVVMVTHDVELALEYSNNIVYMGSPEGDWGERLHFPFGDGDGWGEPNRFAMRRDGQWIEATADWLPKEAAFEEIQDVA